MSYNRKIIVNGRVRRILSEKSEVSLRFVMSQDCSHMVLRKNPRYTDDKLLHIIV